ncbi:MAG: tRNA modification GTPase [Acidobacteria bacterium]|nr:tRNA modification GTPase [Acidobacteriota bacterium]
MIGSSRLEGADTIVAIATPPGQGALGTVRISGPAARRLARELFRPWRKVPVFPPDRVAVSGTALAPASPGDPAPATAERPSSVDRMEPLDHGVLVFFPAADSPTGEDLVEITLHGSPVVLALFAAAAQACGARQARPGEFSYRAFLNGRLDAVQAEAIDDLVRARTAHQARVAHGQQTGALARAVEPARQALVDWLARLEGSIEFGATEDEDFLRRKDLVSGLAALAASLDGLLAQAGRGLLLNRGVRVVLAGEVNAGKSTLFNAWLERDRAIVSESPGTTRDILEAEVAWEGLPVMLVDTAGERTGVSPAAGTGMDPVEQEGQRRGAAARIDADLVIWLLDSTVSPAVPLPPPVAGEAERLLVMSKADLVVPRDGMVVAGLDPGNPLAVSVRTGAGLDDLKRAALALLAPGWDRRERPLVTRLRQQGCLQRAVTALTEARELAASGAGEELIVVPLGDVLTALAALTGRGDLEEVYDRVFSSFCIGK